MFAVIETGGKQYRVSPGEKIQVEKLPGEAGSVIKFDKILLIAEGADAVRVGAPYVTSGGVTGKILRQARTGKKIVFRYHSKTRYRKKNTHRQDFTEIEITEIK